MKLLWLDINSSFSHSSLALPAINAQWREKGVEWYQVTSIISSHPGKVLADVVEKNPDVICATAWLFNHDYLHQVIGRIKSVLPDTIVVLGGPEFLGNNKVYLQKHSEIAAVFRGGGKNVFPQWLHIWNHLEEWRNIDGICYIDSEGKYIDNGKAEVKDFASLNKPESSAFFNWTKPFVQLETTRGCFNSCMFCVSGQDKPVRKIPIDTVKERIVEIKNRGIREFRLLDRTFNGNETRSLALLELFTEFPDCRFHLEIHPAFLTHPIRSKLAGMPANLLHLEAGIQSLEPDVLSACKRSGNPEKAIEGLRFLCSLKNMETHTDLIAGLPHYTLRQIFRDVRLLSLFGAKEIQLELLKLLPGTEMRERAGEFGISYAPYAPYEVLQTPNINVSELQTARLLSRLLDMYYNCRAWHDITRNMIVQYEEFLNKFLEWMRQKEWLDQPLSIEKRGLLLFEFCNSTYSSNIPELQNSWIAAGLTPRKIERFL